MVIGNREVKELTCTTHGHELRAGGCWRAGGCRAEGVSRGTIGKTVIA